MAHYDLVIIGTGSANTILDERFADWRVAIVEKGVFGGTCLNVGCIPTKMFVYPADLAHAAAIGAPRLGVDSRLDGVRWREIRDRVFGRIDPIAAAGHRYRAEHPDNAHVTVYDGTARFVGDKTLAVATAEGSETVTGDRFVLGAGSRATVPAVPGLDEVDHYTSDTVMRMEELPASMVILGSGFIAAEFAHVFASFGVDVTVIARSGALLRTHDGDISRRFTDVSRERYDVRLNHDAVAARRTGHGIELDLAHGDEVETVTGEVLLVATGRVPNADLLEPEQTGVAVVDGRVAVDEYQRTRVSGIYALGDLSSPYQLKHVANHEARVVQHNLLHPDDPVAADHRFVPHAVFTHPQIASVGLTEEEARAQGIDYVSALHDVGDVAYGWAMEDTTGFVKLLADPASSRLLGAHVIGPQASTVLQPAIQAMSFDLDVRELARGQYWIHPGLPEALENALLKLELD